MKFDQKLNNLVIKINIYEEVRDIEVNGIVYKYIFKLSDDKFSSINKNDLVKQIITEDNYKQKLYDLDSNFFLIIWSVDYLFCTVDHIGSYQLAYKFENNQIIISNNLSSFNNSICEHSFNSILYSGYTLGNKTLYKNYRTLYPCEFLIYKNNVLKKNFFYNINFVYNSSPTKEFELEEIIEKLFLKLKKRYSECNIVVPLSAGIDSRLILSSLKYFGFQNVKLFTHYNQNKRDKNIAYKLSKYFDYPIELIKLKFQDCKKIYRSNKFNEYQNYKLVFNSLNNHGDFISIEKLIKKKFINIETDLIMNGQSGDFISGNHIPMFLFEKKNTNIENIMEKTLDYIIFKHFNLWSEEKFNKDQLSLRNMIKKKYFNSVKNIQEIIGNYEKFEFENRQVKWVIGQQKVYDFFKLSCYLPLWSITLVDFFSNKISVEQKKGQKLYKELLIKKNYSGVWKSIPINPKERFGIYLRLLRITLKCIFFFFGKKSWHKFEKKYLSYFMDSTYATSFYTYFHYIKTKKTPRNVIALMAKDFLKKKK